MILKKLHWTLKRHPFLYMTRFRLLSKNATAHDISGISYNDLNKKEDMPQFFSEIEQQIFAQGKPQTDFELVGQLVNWLALNTKVGPGLSVPSSEALDALVNGKGGVCSDMAQIFNNFCVLNDILVREWGTTSAPFNPAHGGHSFNEVYLKELNKWVLVDASWGGVFYNAQKQPLSVVELYEQYRGGENITYGSLIEGKEISPDLISKNYLNPHITPFLICNYRNRLYDGFLKFARPLVPVFIIHFCVFLTGKSYHYKFPLDDYHKIFL